MNLVELKKLSIEDLPAVARDIRARILSVLSKNGGHLASNLGSVELTLALHYVFSSPQDRLIFDVGHQCYTHKLLTGRDTEAFTKIRKSGGWSGFTHPKESPHDTFFAGHAGTALSLGLGLAHSRSTDSSSHILPILGDAALTCGLTLEALNNIPLSLHRFLVILNDNAMSISKNVGGITTILSRLLSRPSSYRFSRQIDHYLSRIPLYGDTLVRNKKKWSEACKTLFSVAPFFEHFGLHYSGPIDGHDFNQLIPFLQSLQDQSMPILAHIHTQKGRGLSEAEADPIAFHGVRPFCFDDCQYQPIPSTDWTFPKIFGDFLLEYGAAHPELRVVTPAMSLGSCLDPFFRRHPQQSFDVGIAEGHAVTFAAGLAKDRSLSVVCSIYCTFLSRAADSILHDVCLQEIPVVFALDRAGFAPADGATHHGIYDLSYLTAFPRMAVCQPRDGQMLVDLLFSAFEWKQPVAIRYPNTIAERPSSPPQFRPLGKGEIVSPGTDLVIFALGTLVSVAKKVRESLLNKGIEAMIVDPIFVKPLDGELISHLLLSHSKLVVVEEHSLQGGLGQTISQFLHQQGFDSTQLCCIGVPDRFFDHGSHPELYQHVGLDAQQITNKILLEFSWDTPRPFISSK